MVVSNDVVCDVISRVLRREKGRIARKNVEGKLQVQIEH